eukprot:TRINITY_DN2791_c1_g1_i2.p1 TRINITY_DN2791_c1_g1~~TRINITY_DN2791_c1_g1_i2.p1  ORF type:complete len:441 (+),score=183.15 TRINITY_DN2791_c1_g1_i2:110-1432(+)
MDDFDDEFGDEFGDESEKEFSDDLNKSTNNESVKQKFEDNNMTFTNENDENNSGVDSTSLNNDDDDDEFQEIDDDFDDELQEEDNEIEDDNFKSQTKMAHPRLQISTTKVTGSSDLDDVNETKNQNSFQKSTKKVKKSSKHKKRERITSSKRASMYGRSTDGELIALRKKMDIYQRENHALRRKLETCSTGIERITDLQNLVAEKEATNEQLMTENKTLQKVIKTQEKELLKPDTKDEEIDRLVNEVNGLSGNFRTAQKRLNELREKNHDLMANNEQIKAINGTLKRIMEAHDINADDQLKQLETIDVFAKIKGLETQLEELTRTIDFKEAKINTLKKAKISVEDRLKGELHIMYEKIAEKEIENTTLQTQLQEALKEARSKPAIIFRDSPLTSTTSGKKEDKKTEIEKKKKKEHAITLDCDEDPESRTKKRKKFKKEKS